MADDKKSDAKGAPAPAGSFFAHPDPFVEIVWLVISILLIIYFLNGFVSFLTSGGVLRYFGLGSNTAPKTIPLSEAPTLLGSKVETSRKTPVFELPGVNQIDERLAGASGVLIDGPVSKDGTKYWKVRFNDGKEGWVAEDDLDHIGINSKKTDLSSMPTIIGDDVLTLYDGTTLYDSPAGKNIGVVKKGIRGEIIEGPETIDGIKYWHIKFDNGQEGWVVEQNLGYIVSQNYGFVKKIKDIFSKLKYLILLIVTFILWCIFYLLNKIKELRLNENSLLYPEVIIKEKAFVNPQWERVLIYLESFGENDWKLAIIEADIMLNDLLDKLSLPGDTMSDKLKAVEKSDFLTIDNAWEGHKIRNQIAHEGASFVLNQREARRVIDLYRGVFEEFKII